MGTGGESGTHGTGSVSCGPTAKCVDVPSSPWEPQPVERSDSRRVSHGNPGAGFVQDQNLVVSLGLVC